MGNCFKNKATVRSTKYVISNGNPNESAVMEDLEMGAFEKPMPPKPASVDPVDQASWKLSCMSQLREQLEQMYGVIEWKVKSFEKKVQGECRRTDLDKLLYGSFLDYTDCLRMSKERLMIMLKKDERRH